MKGYIPIEIPTKRYIKAYIHAQLGEYPMMSTDHRIGSKLYDVLNHEKNECGKRFSTKRYNCSIKLYVSYHTWYHRGAFLNETNIKNFNLFIEHEIKNNFRFLMDFFIELHPNFEANLPEVRKKLGIDLEDWQDDSMKKDYYRYRLKTNKPLLYTRDQTRVTPTKMNVYSAF